jgi:hypothetical protein
MIGKFVRIAALQIVLGLMMISLCSAKDWYVRPSGGTYGAGSGASYTDAWSGFSRIVWGSGGVTAGDTLYICGAHGQTLSVGTSGASGAKITIRGNYTSDPGSINVNYGANNCVDIGNRSYIVVDGLTLRKSRASGIHAQNAYRCEIKNCNFRAIASGGTNFGIDGRYASGLYIYGNSMNNSEGTFNATGIVVNLGRSAPEQSVIEKNTITSIEVDGIVTGDNVVVMKNTVGRLLNTSTHSDGIVSQGSNVVIRQNTVYDCTQCIYVDSFDFGSGSQCICNNVSVWGNLIYGTSVGHSIGVNGISVDVETAGVASIDSLRIYNNTIVDCNYNGMNVTDRVGGRLRNLAIRNNIVVNSGGYSRGINLHGNPAVNPSLDYNMIYSNYDSSERGWNWYGSAKTVSEMRAMGFEAHGKFQNPLFTKYVQNASDNVYTLTSGSAAVDAALNLGADFAFDREAYSRPQGNAWDIGAYEYVSGTPQTSKPNPPKNLRLVS